MSGSEYHGGMLAHRIASVVSEEGTVTLDRLPFQKGERVDIIMLPAAENASIDGMTREELLTSLAGKITRYDRPHDPVLDPEEIDCLRASDQMAG